MRTLLIAVALLLAAPAAASACKCVVPGDPAKEIDAAGGAAWAKVVKRTVIGQEAVRYRLKVIKDYKGNLPNRITVGARRSSAACGLELAEGNKVGLLLTPRRRPLDVDLLPGAHPRPPRRRTRLRTICCDDGLPRGVVPICVHS